MYRVYSDEICLPIVPEKIILEDSNSGYEFFKAVSAEYGILCESAEGKSKLNKAYLHEKNKTMILNSIKGIKWKQEGIGDNNV